MCPGICMVFYAQVAWCSSKTVLFAVHLTSLLSKHQLAENVVFYAQETLNSSEPCFFTHKKPSTPQNRVFSRARNPQLLRTVVFYVQETLNSDLMRNYRFQGSLLGFPLGWPEKVLEMASFERETCEECCPWRFLRIHGFFRTRNPQLLRTVFFHAQETLNSSEPCFFTRKKPS